jgi:hypothetical protein
MNNLFLVVGKDAYDMHSTMKPVKKLEMIKNKHHSKKLYICIEKATLENEKIVFPNTWNQLPTRNRPPITTD